MDIYYTVTSVNADENEKDSDHLKFLHCMLRKFDAKKSDVLII